MNPFGNLPEEEIKKYKAREKFNTGRGPDESFDKLSNEMKDFVEELYELYPNVEFTSGYRGSENDNKDSHHYKGNAVDIKPDVDLWNILLNTKPGVSLLHKYNLGILDETNPATKAATKATGDHFHIGKDSSLSKKIKTRFDTLSETGFDEEGKVLPEYTENPYVAEKKEAKKNPSILRKTNTLQVPRSNIEKALLDFKQETPEDSELFGEHNFFKLNKKETPAIADDLTIKTGGFPKRPRNI